MSKRVTLGFERETHLELTGNVTQISLNGAALTLDGDRPQMAAASVVEAQPVSTQNKIIPGKLDFSDVGFKSIADLEKHNRFHFQALEQMQVMRAPWDEQESAVRGLVRATHKYSANKCRSELIPKCGSYEFGKGYFTRIWVYFPKDNAGHPADVTFLQWHGKPEKDEGENYRTPPVALVAIWGKTGVRIQLNRRWDSSRISTKNSIQEKKAVISTADYDTLTEFIVFSRFDYKSDGELEIWQDGKSIFEHDGPNCYKDDVAPYVKRIIYTPEMYRTSGRDYKSAKAREYDRKHGGVIVFQRHLERYLVG